jgi:anion-transporting  ArsA/GET3 family ATPase
VARRAASVIDRLAGASVLEDIREFFRLASGLSGALRERNAAVYTLLRSDRTRFRLVTSPQADQTDEVESFARVLRDEQMALHGLVVNRVVAMPRLGRPIAADRLPRPDGLGDADWDRTAAVLGALPERVATIARRHADAIAALSAAAGGAPVAVVPDRAGGIRSLDGLASIGPFLGR